jgi:hypothetical protein
MSYWCFYFISLDTCRYEVCNRAGSGFFLNILITFSHFNIEKVGIRSKDHLELLILELLPALFKGIFVHFEPVRICDHEQKT